MQGEAHGKLHQRFENVPQEDDLVTGQMSSNMRIEWSGEYECPNFRDDAYESGDLVTFHTMSIRQDNIALLPMRPD